MGAPVTKYTELFRRETRGEDQGLFFCEYDAVNQVVKAVLDDLEDKVVDLYTDLDSPDVRDTLAEVQDKIDEMRQGR